MSTNRLQSASRKRTSSAGREYLSVKLGDEVWEAVQARQRKAPSEKRQTGYVRKKRLLSGLIKCGVCSSPMVVDGNDRNGAHILRRESATLRRRLRTGPA
jgi:hypothetical protein